MDAILSKALREFITGPLNQLIVNLGGQNGDHWEQQFKQFLRKEPCWIDGQITQVTQITQVAQSISAPSILKLVGTVVVSAITTTFVAKNAFVLDTGHKARVKIIHLDDNFTAWLQQCPYPSF